MPALGSGEPAEVRFWRHVAKGDDGECWLWTAAVVVKYGVFSSDERVISAGRRKQKPIKAHRFSWILANGPIPDGMLVCHHCDNPICVNPAHLFLGTTLDNKRDQMAKGRNPNFHGERNPQSQLTAQQVAEIRPQRGARSARLVALDYGVSMQAVYDIWQRRTWTSI